MIYFEDERKVAHYLLEGNTFKEAAEEFQLKERKVENIVNVRIKYNNPEIYALLKKKPYMAFQRIMYKNCTIKESCKVFRISEKTFYEFLDDIFKADKKAYIKLRCKLYMAKKSDK